MAELPTNLTVPPGSVSSMTNPRAVGGSSEGVAINRRETHPQAAVQAPRVAGKTALVITLTGKVISIDHAGRSPIG
jgi:hypothetical protein